MVRVRLKADAARALAEPVRAAKPTPGCFDNEPRSALEQIALMAERGCFRDGRVGGGGGRTALDIAHALSYAKDPLSESMAVAIACQSFRERDKIVTALVHYVIVECNRDRIEPKLLEVGEQCELAFDESVEPPRREPLGTGPAPTPKSRYYRWAAHYMAERAESAARKAIKALRERTLEFPAEGSI